MLKITKYQVNNPILRLLIKYFWVIKSDKELDIDNILLPVNNIDFILNLSSTISYVNCWGKEITPESFHFCGISSKHRTIKQKGKLDVIGISFYPIGLYAIMQIPLGEFTDSVQGLKTMLPPGFSDMIGDKVTALRATEERLLIIEEELLKLVNFDSIPTQSVNRTFNEFYKRSNIHGINEFCNKYGIGKKTLERFFIKHVGIGPKEFQRIIRFQNILDDLLNASNDNLTTIAYKNNFYDQAHFIKDFKTFTGQTPKQFVLKKKAVKQII